MNRCFAIFLALLCLGVSFTTQAEKPAVTYTLGALEAQPGTTVSGYLEVPAGVEGKNITFLVDNEEPVMAGQVIAEVEA